MSDTKNTSTVEVPRELVDRLLALGAECFRPGNTTATDLRACIKPRRWEFERKYVRLDSMRNEIAAFHDQKHSSSDFAMMGMIPVRVIVEEIV